jgi:hypothetical protein
MKNIFEAEISNEVIERINKLNDSSTPLWGKMNVSQMLAHCCVPYEMVYDNTHIEAGTFKTFILKLFVKNVVVGPKPYKRNSPTPSAFVIKNERDFETEKNRLVTYIDKTQKLGGSYFDGKKSNSLGNLSESE